MHYKENSRLLFNFGCFYDQEEDAFLNRKTYSHEKEWPRTLFTQLSSFPEWLQRESESHWSAG